MPVKRRWLAAQGLASIALLYFLLRRLDFAAFRALFLKLPVWFYLLSLVVVLAGQIAYAWRWRLLLVAAGVHVPLRTVVQQYFIGICLSNFLPSTVGGDLARVYYLGRDHGYRPVMASVALDRLLGMGILSLLAALAMWSAPALTPVMATARLAVTGAAVASVLLIYLAAAGTGGLPRRVAWLGPAAVNVAGRLQRFRFDMAVSLRKPRILAGAVIVVAGYFLAQAALYTLYISLLDEQPPSLVMTFAVVSSTSVLSNIPVSLNGIGLREQLHAALLTPLGIPPEAAVGISLLLFAHVLIASAIGLLYWLRAPVLPSDMEERVTR